MKLFLHFMISLKRKVFHIEKIFFRQLIGQNSIITSILLFSSRAPIWLLKKRFNYIKTQRSENVKKEKIHLFSVSSKSHERNKYNHYTYIMHYDFLHSEQFNFKHLNSSVSLMFTFLKLICLDARNIVTHSIMLIQWLNLYEN